MAAAAAAAPSTTEAVRPEQQAASEGQRCPFAGGNLFTRLTHTAPPKGHVTEGEQLSTTPREYLPFKVRCAPACAAVMQPVPHEQMLQDQPWTGLSTGLTPIDPEHIIEIDEHYGEGH